MKVILIGTNGLLSSAIGVYCETNNFILNVFGRTKPRMHKYDEHFTTNLLCNELDYDKLIDADLIIYAAGGGVQSGLKQSFDDVFNLNFTVPARIFNNLKELNYKGSLITFGSYFEIGENHTEVAFNETNLSNSVLRAPNDYTISKRVLSRFINSVTAAFNFYHFILPTIYGEFEAQGRLIPYTLERIKNDADLSFTSGNQIRQYIYIEDVVELIFKSVKLEIESGIYNVEGVEEFTVKSLVEQLFFLNKKEIPEGVFGKADRADVGMKVLKLDGKKLTQAIKYIPGTKIADVYEKYKFD